jgi:phage gp29-like protein
MATNETTPIEKPTFDEVAVVTSQDIGANFAQELQVANDEILKAKGGDLVIYDKVLADDQCYSTFKQLRTDITARETHVEPGGDAPIDKLAADDLRAQLEALSWDAITRKMLKGVWSGYGVSECLYGTDGKHILLNDIKVRKARRFKFDVNGALRLVRKDLPEGTVMPPNKFWVFRADSDDDDDPYPLGLGYYCYWPVWFKRNMMRFWALWGEKFASPTPVAKFPSGAGDGERKKALDLAKSILLGGAIAIPNSVALELLQALARAGDDYEKFCHYADACVSKVVLCQTMTTDNGSSLSQANVHADVKVMVSKTYADLICESFMRGPATWLTLWNYPGAKTPKVWRDYSESEDLKAAAERDVQLNTIGYRPSAQRVQETYGDGYDFIDPKTQGASPDATQQTSGQAAFAEPNQPLVGPADNAIENLIGGDKWEKVIGPQVEAVQQFVEGASSLEDVRNRLDELAKTSPATITDSLARVMFAANIAGQVGAEVDAD